MEGKLPNNIKIDILTNLFNNSWTLETPVSKNELWKIYCCKRYCIDNTHLSKYFFEKNLNQKLKTQPIDMVKTRT
jgi:hypothetical protein